MSAIIHVEKLSKVFRVQHVSERTVKQGLVNFLHRSSHYKNFTALDDVSVSTKAGECFGVIGPNGSGKSTFMRILAGIYKPTSGSVTVAKSVVPLFGIGVGFHPQLTATDNLYLYGSVLGINRKLVKKRMNNIIEFAELEDFMDTKLAHFSSGMRVRLGFALAVQVEAEILLLDEVFSVGDRQFRSKCIAEIKRFQEEGRTVVMVTHALERVKQFCSRAMYLRDGAVQMIGNPEEVVARYKRDYE